MTGRSPGEGNDYTLQYSCLEIPWTEEPGRPQSLGSERVGMTERVTLSLWGSKGDKQVVT